MNEIHFEETRAALAALFNEDAALERQRNACNRKKVAEDESFSFFIGKGIGSPCECRTRSKTSLRRETKAVIQKEQVLTQMINENKPH